MKRIPICFALAAAITTLSCVVDTASAQSFQSTGGLRPIVCYAPVVATPDWKREDQISKNYGDIRVRGFVDSRTRTMLGTTATEVNITVETKVHGRNKNGRGHLHVILIDNATERVVKSYLVSKYAASGLSSSKTKSETKKFVLPLNGVTEPWLILTTDGKVKSDVPLTSRDASEFLKKNIGGSAANLWSDLKKSGGRIVKDNAVFKKLSK